MPSPDSRMTTVLRLSNILSWICLQAARFAGLLLFVLTAVIIYDVIGRKFFATGSFKLQELEWHLHGAIGVLCFGYAYTRNAHVRIDIFANRMSGRFKLHLEMWAILLFLIPFMTMFFWFGYDFAMRSFLRGETSSGGLGLSHRWIIKSAVPISALLVMMGGLSVALRCWVILRRPDLLKSPFETSGLWRR